MYLYERFDVHIFFYFFIFSHILKVPFENSGGSGIVYIWIGSEATQEEAIHAEQMGRGMFEVGEVIAFPYFFLS